jgi:hypothetical protein
MFLFLICQACPSFLVSFTTHVNHPVLVAPRGLFPLNCISCSTFLLHTHTRTRTSETCLRKTGLRKFPAWEG